MENKIILKSESDTINFAKELSLNLKKGDVIALYGDLGAGKTFFVSALCKFLDCKDIVSSPSYMIMHEYRCRITVYHIDLYRLSTEEDVLELGLEEIFDKGITIIEWPELAEFLLPKNTIKLFWKIKDNNRIVIIKKPA